MNIIEVVVSKKYNVLIGKGLISKVGELINPICKSNRITIVTDDKVDLLYSNEVSQALEKQNFLVDRFVFKNGEKSKNIKTLSNLLEFSIGKGLRRNDMLIALGGGVVGDVTGLAASLYMRGISFVQIPTTLLSMVDASIGGKTAINLKHGKNLVGTFWQPSLVICDTDIIRSMPSGLFSEGMAEVIKCDVIQDLNILDHIKNHSVTENIDKIIEKCISLKRDIVQRDEYDTMGVRNLLNAGHTIAHGIEKLSKYSISHGKAVGTGLLWESLIAYELGICDLNLIEKIIYAIKYYNLFVPLKNSINNLLEAMLSDKKNTDSRVTFILPTSEGVCIEKKINVGELEVLLKKVQIHMSSLH